MYSMMIVDDNPWIRDELVNILDWDSLGIKIAGICANGKEAFEQAEIENPDIILADIAMPVMNGIELAKRLRETGSTAKLIFMSSYSEFNFAKSAIDMDIYGYVLKPIVPEELGAVVKKVLDIYSYEKSKQNEKDELIKQLNDSLPLLREQFLRDLLFGVYNEADEIDRRFRFLGLHPLEATNIRVVSVFVNEYEKLTRDMDTSEKYLYYYYIKKVFESKNRDAMTFYAIFACQFLSYLRNNIQQITFKFP